MGRSLRNLKKRIIELLLYFVMTLSQCMSKFILAQIFFFLSSFFPPLLHWFEGLESDAKQKSDKACWIVTLLFDQWHSHRLQQDIINFIAATCKLVWEFISGFQGWKTKVDLSGKFKPFSLFTRLVFNSFSFNNTFWKSCMFLLFTL